MGYSAMGVLFVDNSLARSLVQNRIGPLQSFSGLFHIIGLHRTAYSLDRILDMALDHSISGSSFETLTMTFQGLLCICQAA
jgi:hypothetical protein